MFKRLLLVEDETFALEDLRDALLRISPSLEIVTARSGSQALELLRNEKFDALFLDIELPGIGGLDVMRELGAAAPPTVLVTGHLREAIEAFGLGVVECILKPVDDAKLREIVEKLSGGPQTWQVPAAATGAQAAGEPRRLLLRDGRRSWLVAMKDIIRFEQEGPSVRGIFQEGSGLVETSLATLLALDPSLAFFPANAFTIVNPAAVHCLNRGLDEKLVVRCSDGAEVPFDPEYEPSFLEKYSL